MTISNATDSDLRNGGLLHDSSDNDAEHRRRTRERRRRVAKLLRRSLLAAALIGGLAAAALALRPRPVPVDVAPATHGPLSVEIEESGVTRVKDRYVISAPVSGSVSRLVLEAGDAVKEGDALVEIAPASSPLLDERTRAQAEARLGASQSALGQARAQIARARAAKELADSELARLRPLSSNGSIAQQVLENAEFAARMRAEELSSAEFAAKVAGEEVRIAQVALGQEGKGPGSRRHVDVLAPLSGTILRIHQESAAVVAAGAPLVEVGNPEALEVVVDLLTTDAVSVRPGTSVVIDDWGGEGPLSGRVRRVEPSGFTRASALGVDEQRVNVIVALTEPRTRWSALGDGYHVEATIVLWQAERVLKVPQGALFRRGDGWAVFRLEDDRARLTTIKIGHRGQSEVEVLSGLVAGAQVVVHPGDRVKEGVLLRIQ
jgi:HlyD family secretion protein